MLRKLSFIVPIAASVLFIGCAVPGQIKTENSSRAVTLTPRAEAHPMVAELEVSEKKVMGQASGKALSQATLEIEAVAAALKQTDGDVLVGVNYFYETLKSSDLTVTAVGYPARYKNFRPKEANNDNKANVLLKGQFIYEDGSSNNLSVTVKNTTHDVAPVASSAQAVPSAHVAPAAVNAPEE